MNEPPVAAPLEVALADLKARRAKLDTAIAAIEELLGLQSSSPSQSPGGPTAAADAWVNGQIPSDAFFGMGIPDGTRKYLRMVRRKAPAAEIARALEQGGMTHSSKYFPNTVRTTLARIEKQTGDIVQVGKDWGLAEWYPGRKRKERGSSAKLVDQAELLEDSE
jgi:hypothetical protein